MTPTDPLGETIVMIPEWHRREPVLIEAIRDAECPSHAEMDAFAKRIWQDLGGDRGSAWKDIPRTSGAYRRAMHIAHAALGDMRSPGSLSSVEADEAATNNPAG